MLCLVWVSITQKKYTAFKSKITVTILELVGCVLFERSIDGNFTAKLRPTVIFVQFLLTIRTTESFGKECKWELCISFQASSRENPLAVGSRNRLSLFLVCFCTPPCFSFSLPLSLSLSFITSNSLKRGRTSPSLIQCAWKVLWRIVSILLVVELDEEPMSILPLSLQEP